MGKKNVSAHECLTCSPISLENADFTLEEADFIIGNVVSTSESISFMSKIEIMVYFILGMKGKHSPVKDS